MIIQKEFLNKIKDFGLNTYEAKLWTALLSRGVSTAGELSDIANVPRSRSYDVLESLEERGVLTVELPNPDFYILLGKCREECNDAVGAFEAYEKALELDPESIAVMIAMAAINLNDDNYRIVNRIETERIESTI